MNDAPPFVLPRALIFLASLWLIGSWIIGIGLRPPIDFSSTSYESGVRLILLSMTTGLVIGWPLFRLSQGPSHYPVRETALDLLVLLAMMQVVLWPLRFVTTWSVSRTAAIDAVLCGWTILAGAFVTSALTSGRAGPRALAMAGCLGLCLLGPALAWGGAISGADTNALVDLSPLLAVRALGDGGGAPIRSLQWAWIGLLHVAGGLAWIAAIAAGRLVVERPAHARDEA